MALRQGLRSKELSSQSPLSKGLRSPSRDQENQGSTHCFAGARVSAGLGNLFL
jgi:hypothetical protein